MIALFPYPITVGQTTPKPGDGHRLLKRDDIIRAGDEGSFYHRDGLPDRFAFFHEAKLIWMPVSPSMVGDAYTEGHGALWIRRKVKPPGAVEGRRYGYSIAPKYLKLTIWMFNQGGERLSSSQVHPIPGLSHRERYDVLAAAIMNVGCTPPAYQPPHR